MKWPRELHFEKKRATFICCCFRYDIITFFFFFSFTKCIPHRKKMNRLNTHTHTSNTLFVKWMLWIGIRIFFFAVILFFSTTTITSWILMFRINLNIYHNISFSFYYYFYDYRCCSTQTHLHGMDNNNIVFFIHFELNASSQ